MSTATAGVRRNAAVTSDIRRAWRALVVLAAGLAGTTGLYFLTRQHEKQDLRWATRIAAESFRADIFADVESEIGDLIRLIAPADKINSPGHPWREHAERYIQRRPGCIAVEFLTSAYVPLALVYGPAERARKTPLAYGGVPLDLLKDAAGTARPLMSRFIAVDERHTQRITVVPVEMHGEPGGFVVGFFDVQERLDSILDSAKNLGFSLRLLEGGRERYRVMKETKNSEAQQYTETAEVELPGVTWELRVWPESPTLHAMDSTVPDEITLMTGALISVLLASTVHFAYTSRRRSRNLRQLNAELLEEVRQREGAEEELRRAHDQLEGRVRERTAELSTAKARLEQEIVGHARAEESLQKLTGQLFQSQNEERRRLARELHDGATQNLIAVAMNMAILRSQTLSAEQRTELLDDSVRLIQQSVGELRTTSHLLHPPLIDELGLPVTLRSYVDGFSARSGIRVDLVLDPQLGRLNRDAELGIFRIVQESLANVHRHSHSETAKIVIRREDAHIRLEISDEGTGIPADLLATAERGAAGVGIASMRERARLLGGRFEFRSGNTGTSIRVLLPVTAGTSALQPAASAGAR